jgi:hypothetical protein
MFSFERADYETLDASFKEWVVSQAASDAITFCDSRECSECDPFLKKYCTQKNSEYGDALVIAGQKLAAHILLRTFYNESACHLCKNKRSITDLMFPSFGGEKRCEHIFCSNCVKTKLGGADELLRTRSGEVFCPIDGSEIGDAVIGHFVS